MNIEEQVKQAIEEFGDDAHKRFNKIVAANGIHSIDLRSNELMLLAIDSGDRVKIRPLPELSVNDVEVYGDNAYLMWEISLSSKNSFVQATDNTDIKWSFDSINYKQRRKISADLPFDLQRAKAGDPVYALIAGEWITLLHASGAYDFVPENEYRLLRMKYPRKLVQ